MFGRNVDQLIKCQAGDEKAFGNLLFLWLLQHLRAERTITEHLLMMSAIREKASLGQDDNKDLQDWLGPPMGTPEALEMMLDGAREYFNVVSDLRCVLLINNTQTKFVLSDCPAVFSNKFILKRYRHMRNWGFASAGLYLYLPRTPRLGFFAFDRHVYELGSRQGSICELKEKDAVALNQLVYLFCNDLVVLPPYCDVANTVCQLKKVDKAKPERTVRVNVATEDQNQHDEGTKQFSVVSDEEFAGSTKRGLIHVERVRPIAPLHLPKLRIRQNPKYVDTQSIAGLERYRI